MESVTEAASGLDIVAASKLAGDAFVLLGVCLEGGGRPGCWVGLLEATTCLHQDPPVLSLTRCHSGPLLSRGDGGVVDTAFLAPHSCRCSRVGSLVPPAAHACPR